MTSLGKKLLGLAGSNLKQISSGSPKTPLRNISNVLPPTPKTSKYDAGTMKSFLEYVKTNAELRKEALEKEEEENVNNNTFMLDEEMQEELQQGRQQEVEKELNPKTRFSMATTTLICYLFSASTPTSSSYTASSAARSSLSLPPSLLSPPPFRLLILIHDVL